MLKHEVGLDIDSIFVAPKPLLPDTYQLQKPGNGELKGFTLLRVPTAVLSGVTLPIRWVWVKLTHLRFQKPPKVPYLPELPRFQYEGEAREELEDAICPVYDQLQMHWYWKVMEWIPWVIKKQSAEIADSDDVRWAYKFIWNRGKGRQVYHLVMDRGMKVHRSVRIRMQAHGPGGQKKPYLPKVRCVINGQVRCLTIDEWLAEEPQHFMWVD